MEFLRIGNIIKCLSEQGEECELKFVGSLEYDKVSVRAGKRMWSEFL
jgi:hypothetical protein